jgi:hypothetical protein
MEEKTDGTFGLLTFVNNDEFNSFKNDINNLLRKSNYINDNINYTFNNDICICNVSKTDVPPWNNNVVFKENINENKNHTHYRIILIKYSENIYYFERNGNISVFDILNKYSFDLFVKTKWNKLFNEKLSFKELINNYLINDIKHTDNIKILNEYFSDNNFENIDFNNINTYEKIYNEIPELQEELKLIPYDYKKCIQKTKSGDKQSETIYNKIVCENNNNYILLDCITIDGCEVCDIYDKNNNIFFHNKKSGDLRCLGFQTIIGSLILKNKFKCDEYFDKLDKKGIDYTQVNTENFKFVVGIIQITKTINYKDKITLGIVYCYLKKMSVNFYIDKIDVINKQETETKDNTKPKSKSKSK